MAGARRFGQRSGTNAYAILRAGRVSGQGVGGVTPERGGAILLRDKTTHIAPLADRPAPPYSRLAARPRAAPPAIPMEVRVLAEQLRCKRTAVQNVEAGRRLPSQGPPGPLGGSPGDRRRRPAAAAAPAEDAAAAHAAGLRTTARVMRSRVVRGAQRMAGSWSKLHHQLVRSPAMLDAIASAGGAALGLWAEALAFAGEHPDRWAPLARPGGAHGPPQPPGRAGVD